LFYSWKDGQLSVKMLWVDDCLMAGPKEQVLKAKTKFMTLFDCEDIGEMKEYVGCSVTRGDGWLRMTQPLQLRKFKDEFDLETQRAKPKTPAEPNSVLNEGDQGTALSEEKQSDYRKGVGILLHMMRWSRSETLNAVRELSRHLKEATDVHYKQMIRIMNYCVSTPERGNYLKPERRWDGRSHMPLRISGMSDSEYIKDPSRHSVNGWICFLEGCPINCASKMMPVIALSVTEAELYAAVQCAQDMMYSARVLLSIGIPVEFPMKLEVDNKGAVDLCNNWSVGGRTRHIEVKQYFLRELKEEGVIEVKWKAGDEMTADILTKNLGGTLFAKHAEGLVGKDKYQKGKEADGETKADTDESIHEEEEIGQFNTKKKLSKGQKYYYEVWNSIID